MHMHHAIHGDFRTVWKVHMHHAMHGENSGNKRYALIFFFIFMGGRKESVFVFFANFCIGEIRP
jgi:hypothetical protein